MTVNIQNIFKENDDNESIDFESIYKHLISQRKLSIFIFLISFITLFFPLAIKKILRDFSRIQLLIQDPVSSRTSSTSNFSSNISLAGLSSLNPKGGNFPTLKTYLTSNEVLEELALKFGYKQRI